MSVAFVTKLRSGRPPIQLAETGKGTITIRVEASDLWDTVRVVTRADAPAGEVKQRVVEALFAAEHHADDFVLKFRGWEVLDLNASLSASGVVDGSILLLAHRRRRPVR